MMKNLTTAILSGAIVALSSSLSFAHEVPGHEHAQLVPIPAYQPPEGGANAEASLAILTTLIETFDEDLHSQFMFELDSEKRSNWSNLPAQLQERDGISLKNMSDEQRQLVFDFLSASLGEEGYLRIAEVMAAEQVLTQADKELVERYGWNPENYYFSIFGTPSQTGQWGWQFGGHHLAVNMAVENGVTESLSPSHFGSEPLIFVLDGTEYQNMLDTHAVGLAVYESLDSNQQEQASIPSVGYTVRSDVLTGPGKDGVIPEQQGLYGKEMTPEQQALLLKAIATWVEMQPEENSQKRMKQIEAELDEISFGWAGNENPTDNGYFRIQGPSLVIEHLSFGSVRQVGSEAEGHYHTMYRNPQNEYGLGSSTPEEN